MFYVDKLMKMPKSELKRRRCNEPGRENKTRRRELSQKKRDEFEKRKKDWLQRKRGRRMKPGESAIGKTRKNVKPKHPEWPRNAKRRAGHRRVEEVEAPLAWNLPPAVVAAAGMSHHPVVDKAAAAVLTIVAAAMAVDAMRAVIEAAPEEVTAVDVTVEVIVVLVTAMMAGMVIDGTVVQAPLAVVATIAVTAVEDPAPAAIVVGSARGVETTRILPT